MAHEHVAESAVVGFPHEVKARGFTVCYSNSGVEYTEELRGELKQQVRNVIDQLQP